MISGIFRQTIWNQTIPTEYRGRLAAIEMLSYLTGPLVGASLLGFAADYWSPQKALLYGSLIAFVGVVLLGIGNRKFWNYEAKTPSETAISS